MAANAYLTALAMLARRELSTYHVRQRLGRRGYEAEAIDEAVARLTSERALDDTRTAGAIARTELRLRGRGRARILRTVEAAGIRSDIARAAVDEAFESVDVEGLLLAALDKRLRSGAAIADDRDMRRLFRYLLSQGFEADRVMAALRARRRS